MAKQKTIIEVVGMLFQSPLANKPKPLPGQDEEAMIENTIRIYALTLQDIDDHLLQAAVVHHIATEKWFPAVADIRTAALSLVDRADETPSAYEAWGEIKRAVRTRAPLSPMTKQAIDYLGGLEAFGLSDISEEMSWRHQFIRSYEQLQRRRADDAMMLPQIAGYVENRRELNGRSVASLIGDVAKKLGAGS